MHLTSTHSADGLRVARAGEHGEVLLMTLDRPDRRNAVDQPLAEQLDAAMTLLESGPGLRVGVLTPEGDRRHEAGSARSRLRSVRTGANAG